MLVTQKAHDDGDGYTTVQFGFLSLFKPEQHGVAWAWGLGVSYGYHGRNGS
jgi:hypothetical protein